MPLLLPRHTPDGSPSALVSDRKDRSVTRRHSSFKRGPRPASASAGSAPRHERRLPSKLLRIVVFGGLAVLIGAAAIALVVIRLTPPAPTDPAALQVRASMDGFTPPALAVKAGRVIKIELASTDTSMHSDGGGWHELAIDALGVDWKVGPESSRVFELPASTPPGTYAWYCDICCGGKENPSMQGTLTVSA